MDVIILVIAAFLIGLLTAYAAAAPTRQAWFSEGIEFGIHVAQHTLGRDYCSFPNPKECAKARLAAEVMIEEGKSL